MVIEALRWALPALALFLTAGPARAADGHPYGCWSIRDDVERLACFDVALGPPVATPDGQASVPGSGKVNGPPNRAAEPKSPDAR